MADNRKKELRKTGDESRSVVRKGEAWPVRIGKRFRKFFQDLRAELKRVIWPDRKRLVQSTATVLAICVLIGLILFLMDTSISETLNAIGFYGSAAPEVTEPATYETFPVATDPTDPINVTDGTTEPATTGATDGTTASKAD